MRSRIEQQSRVHATCYRTNYMRMAVDPATREEIGRGEGGGLGSSLRERVPKALNIGH